MSVCTSSTRSRRAAQCSAVVPSASVAFTSARCFESVRTVAAFPVLTASIRRTSPVAALEVRLAQTTRATIRAAWVSRMGWLKGDAALVAAEVLELDAERLGHADQEVGIRRQRSANDVSAAFHRSSGATDEQRRQQVRRMDVSIAHAAAVQDQGLIEQRAVTVRSGAKSLDEFRKQRQMVGVDLGVRLDRLRPVTVMGDRVVRLGDTDIRIGALAQLASEHEGEHTSQVGLIRDRQQIEQ